jgi:hypothetical protein
MLPLDSGPKFRHGAEQFRVGSPQVRDLGPEGDEFGVELGRRLHTRNTRE